MANALQRLTTGNLLAKFIDGEWVLMKECCCYGSESTSSSSSSSSSSSQSSSSSSIDSSSSTSSESSLSCCDYYTLEGYSFAVDYNGRYNEAGIANGRPYYDHTVYNFHLFWSPTNNRWIFGSSFNQSTYQGRQKLTGQICPDGQYVSRSTSLDDGWFCCEDCSSSSSHSSSSSSSSSSFDSSSSSSFDSSSSSSSSSSYSSSTSSGDDCCNDPDCTGALCSVFTNWVINGGNGTNTDDCTLYVEASYDGGGLSTGLIYKDAFAIDIVAYWFSEGVGTITITDQFVDSGITGTVDYDGSVFSDGSITLSCP